MYDGMFSFHLPKETMLSVFADNQAEVVVAKTNFFSKFIKRCVSIIGSEVQLLINKDEALYGRIRLPSVRRSTQRCKWKKSNYCVPANFTVNVQGV